MAAKALFLDRDGIVNVDTGYVFEVEHFHFVDGIFELCRTATRKGYIIVIATNQSGIERGYFTEDDFRSLTKWMCACFDAEGVTIAEVLHCPTLSGPNRKPNPGMFLTAQKKYGIDMSASISIGDKERDVVAGRRAGIGLNVLFTTSGTKRDTVYTVSTLKEMEDLL
ncbi:MAG: D-glycero-alpha-D-manno-heptose-1,7-bisphosphate 7-phosphatase [Thermoguttaceae bacterium]